MGTLTGFATLAVATGLWLVLGDDPSFWEERVGLALYVAGAPVSGVFAALVGNLPLAPFTDIIVWMAAGGLIARRGDRWPPIRPLLLTIGASLVFGGLVSLLIERV